ncbi:type IV pili methyl-accepting chemotaxis transducer N-terminal domain-containing protein [Variovorax sp. YR216]|uniref:type IV pili methyl-accepting chemotaxis transducer N-terminal domain-containing protein n=1 Tax=Variovorax sp. YR216 TaxID=1882828 RepID=UPI00089517C2|nr:type IV pili methyl-accepting chemotaxis transducer N-terminal domain-containing protein [Variovorax sp. YR216]SEB24425.1 Type IV pili methyl-accepting chemotaxis transducer N-term [Variovorax sp. YR216]
MNRRNAIGWLGSLSLLTVSNNFAQAIDLNDAINKAGRQRMLSQRVVKAYLAAGQGIVTQRADEILAASMTLFERQLVELKAFAPTPDVRATYSELEMHWSDLKAMLVGQAPVRENATALIELDGKVLALANKGTSQLEQVSGKPLGRLVNIAGRQRMLSQRVAKFYLAMAWKVPLPSGQAELDKARAEFVSALEVLANAPEATTAIKQEIELARNQWVFYSAALALRGSDAPTPERSANIFASSENILVVMDKVTGMYSRLAS